MASYFPRRPPLGVPIALLAGSAALFAIGVVMLVRVRDFAWDTFFLVGRWALLAYLIQAGMIEFAFVHNHASGPPLVVVTLMLVMFAITIPTVIAFTVARYQVVQSSDRT
jgi:drug/metabolite transporter (DMT)-like permease